MDDNVPMELFLPTDDDVPAPKVRVQRTVQRLPKKTVQPSGEGQHLRKGTVDLSVIDIVPPPCFWRDVGEYRRKYVAYMPYDAPHVSFINPFLVGGDLEEAAKILTQKYKDLVPCTVTFRKVETMPRKRKNNITVFIQPEVDPPDGMDQLMKIFLEVFPQCNDLWTRHGCRFTPHLTIAQFQSEAEYEKVFPELQLSWKPFSFLLKEIYFITRPLKRHPFEVNQIVPIGPHVTPPHLGPGLLKKENKLHRSLVIVGIPKEFDESALFGVFSKTELGPVLSVKVLQNVSAASWSCGLVEFSTSEAVNKAVIGYDPSIFPQVTYVKPLVYLMIVVDRLEEK